MVQVWYAFRVLSAARTSGYGFPNPISIEAIFTMADHLGKDRDELLFFVQGLDETYLDEVHKKHDSERKRQQRQPPPRGRRRP